MAKVMYMWVGKVIQIKLKQIQNKMEREKDGKDEEYHQTR